MAGKYWVSDINWKLSTFSYKHFLSEGCIAVSPNSVPRTLDGAQFVFFVPTNHEALSQQFGAMTKLYVHPLGSAGQFGKH